MDSVEAVLAHFGVKGMRWGVRKRSSGGSDVSPGDVVVTQRPGGRLKTSGGKHLTPSEDAVRAAAAAQRAKKSGVQSLTNAELQALTTRMNLERQFKSLQPPTAQKAAAKFVADIVLQVGKQQVAKLASDAASKQISAMLNNQKK